MKLEKRKTIPPRRDENLRTVADSLRGMAGNGAISLRLLQGQYGHDRMTMNMRRAL